eukprot:COSAG04_NODE_1192_length_7801_cov_7.001298_9_plen_61_part_00
MSLYEDRARLAPERFWSQAGSSPGVLVLLVIAFIAGQLLAACADYWLALWTTQPRGDSFW